MITLCAQIVALHAPMVAAFWRASTGCVTWEELPVVGPDAATEWFTDILAALQIPLDDPGIVHKLATLVEHGIARASTSRTSRGTRSLRVGPAAMCFPGTVHRTSHRNSMRVARSSRVSSRATPAAAPCCRRRRLPRWPGS